MSSKKENTAHDDTHEDLVVLGVASTDTQGGPMFGEEVGGLTTSGIAQD